MAERAAKLVQVTYRRSHELGKPLLTIADAVAANSFHDPACVLTPIPGCVHYPIGMCCLCIP